MSEGNVWPNKIDLFLHFPFFEARLSSFFLGQMKARWSDQRLLHQHLWDLWYKWTLLIQQRGKRTKDGENINNFSRVHVYFFIWNSNTVFKMALPLKINAEAQADASSDDPICQNLIATQCIGSLTVEKRISGKDQHVLTTFTLTRETGLGIPI